MERQHQARIVCPRKLKAPCAAAGRHVRCPDCGAVQRVPTPTPPSPKAEVATGAPVPDTFTPETSPPEFPSREPAIIEGYRYEALISYRHVEPDRKWAEWFHRALERLRFTDTAPKANLHIVDM